MIPLIIRPKTTEKIKTTKTTKDNRSFLNNEFNGFYG